MTTQKVKEYSVSDVEALANAVIEEVLMWDNSGPWQSEVCLCRFCGELAKNDCASKIKHRSDCPVLVANDVLTH